MVFDIVLATAEKVLLEAGVTDARTSHDLHSFPQRREDIHTSGRLQLDLASTVSDNI